uniref:Uncharacterized protein n=1 Tax=Meloidogyne enterolobii TaxID=390850 RepID=A0A6V7X1X0_MELEN|nr:unnamed protein product [Meloidogyne enterolobii]
MALTSKPSFLFIFLFSFCFMTSINCLLGTYNFNQPVQFNRLFKWDPIQQLTNNNLAKDDGGIPSYSNQNPKRIQLTDEMLQKEIQEILPKVINTKQENIGFYGK